MAISLYGSFAVFLFAAIMLVLPSGYSLGPAMLFIAGLFFAFRKATWQSVDRHTLLIVLALTFYGVVWMAEAVVFDYGMAGFDQPFRFVAAIIALAFLLKYPPKPAFFWAGVGVGAIAVGLFTIDAVLIKGLARGSYEYVNHIQHGNLALLLGFLALAGMGWASTQRYKWAWYLFLLLALILGLAASLLSQTRGGWIAIPFLLLLAYRGLSTHFKWRQVGWGALLLTLAVVFLYLLPHSPVKERVDLAFDEVMAYYQTGDAVSSVGARLEMWRGGLLIAAEHPWLGVGEQGYQQQKLMLIEVGQLDGFVEQFAHLHNQFLERLVKFGVVGLLALLVLYFLPLRVFLSYFNHPNLSVRSYAVAGGVVGVSYIDFSLTEAFLAYNSVIMIFVFLLVIIWSLLRAANLSSSGQGVVG